MKEIIGLVTAYWEAKRDYIQSDSPSSSSEAEMRMNAALQSLDDAGFLPLFRKWFNKYTIPTVGDLEKLDVKFKEDAAPEENGRPIRRSQKEKFHSVR